MFAGDVEHAVAANVLVHDLFQPLQALKRIDIARRDSPGDDLVPAHAVMLQRLEDHFLQTLDVIVVDLR